MATFNCSSYATPQLAINALEAAGGGRLIVPSTYAISSPLILSGIMPTIIEGDGWNTGFHWTGSNNNNIIQIGNAMNVGGNIRINNIRLSQNGGITGTTGIFFNNHQGPVLTGILYENLACGNWLVTSYAPRWYNCQFQGTTYCSIGFDPSTPANNALVDGCNVFGNTGVFMQINAGCNGVYIRSSDIENNPTIIDIPLSTYYDPTTSTLSTPSVICIEDCDIELLSAQGITSAMTINGFRFVGNTTSGNANFDIGAAYNVNGLVFDQNNLHLSAMTITGANCSGYVNGYSDIQIGGSITII